MNGSHLRFPRSLSICLLFFAVVGKPLSSSAQTFSTRAGWGATPYSGGVTFRVWAPNASSVRVAGSFNGFSTTANPLVAEPGGTGIWSVDVPGASDGQQYKYFINGSTYKQDPRSRKQVSSTGNCYIYNTTNFNWAGDTFSSTNVPLSDAVVYELHCGSFNGGTFLNATNKLAYLKQLGVSVVEVMPVAEFPTDHSWGYNPSDIFGVESAYGGPDAFKTFVKTAHQLGMAVVLDVIHNHYGPGDLNYGLWQFDGSYSNNNGGIYFYQQDNLCCTTWGPRPNYSTQQVRNFIQDNFTMWLNECHVDGFRWDSPGSMIYYNGGSLGDASSLIQQISSMIHTAYVGKINIGEDQNTVNGTQVFDATWNGNTFFNNVWPQLAASNDGSRSVSAIDYAVNLNHNGGGLGGWGSVDFLEDHDQCGDLNAQYGANRLPVRIDGANPLSYYAVKRSALGAAITLTSAGIPMILQGEEMLTTNLFSASTPIDWSLTNTYSGNVSLYTDLIRLRRNLDGRSSGLKGVNVSTIFLRDSGTTNKVIAYRRWNTGNVGDDVVVVCNFANTSLTNYSVSGFPHANGTNVWYTQLNTDWTKYSTGYGNYGSLSTTSTAGIAAISIAPYSALILSQNVPGAPPTPQTLTATPAATNQINLAWSSAGGATGYILKREGTPVATTNATHYSDIGLLLGSNYCYTVVATNGGGVSADSAQACATTVLATSATNLLAYWTFDEGSGTTAYDSSGNNSTGTVAGAQWTSSLFGSALNFDGTFQVNVPNSIPLNPVSGLTLSAWINASAWSFTPRIVQKGQSDNQYRLYGDANAGLLVFNISGVTNGTVTTALPGAGAWYHVVGTYDKSLMGLYVNGLLVTQQVASGALPVTTDTLSVGGKPGSGSGLYHFNGIIDDVRIYGSALPPDEIGQLYNTDTVGDGIANWWRLQYFGSGSATDDTSCVNCCANCDADGTGQNNLFKFVAGLNPTDPTEVFTLQIASDPPNQMNLMFSPLAAGRTYTVQSSTDLVSVAYSDLTDINGPVTNGSQVTVTDLNATQTNNFYRVHISLP